MGRLVFALMLILGLLAGGALGIFLKPAPDPEAETAKADGADTDAKSEPGASKDDGAAKDQAKDTLDGGTPEFAKLNNQFVVPVVEQGQVTALVILSLSLQIPPGERETVYEYEPKLRDRLLAVMFDHANAGGFSGAFTDARPMARLREDLSVVAKSVLPGVPTEVLVLDIVRQDVR